MKYNEDLYIVISVMFDGNGETTRAIASFIVLACLECLVLDTGLQ